MYGAADFLGGLASRRASTIAIVVISQLAGLIALRADAAASPDVLAGAGDWMWGAAAGVAGGVGVALLYRALAIGSMAIVAPITAVCAVTVPVAVSIALGERPGAGTTRRYRAGTRVDRARQPAENDHRHRSAGPGGAGLQPCRPAHVGCRHCARLGVAIGLFFLAVAQTRAEAGMWPLVAARGMSFGLFAAFALVTRRSLRMPANVHGHRSRGRRPRHACQRALSAGVAIRPAEHRRDALFFISGEHGAAGAHRFLATASARLQTVGIVCALVAVLLIVGTR